MFAESTNHFNWISSLLWKGEKLLWVQSSGDPWNIKPLIGSEPPAYGWVLIYSYANVLGLFAFRIFVAGGSERRWVGDPQTREVCFLLPLQDLIKQIYRFRSIRKTRESFLPGDLFPPSLGMGMNKLQVIWFRIPWFNPKRDFQCLKVSTLEQSFRICLSNWSVLWQILYKMFSKLRKCAGSSTAREDWSNIVARRNLDIYQCWVSDASNRRVYARFCSTIVSLCSRKYRNGLKRFLSSTKSGLQIQMSTDSPLVSKNNTGITTGSSSLSFQRASNGRQTRVSSNFQAIDFSTMLVTSGNRFK